MGFGILCHRLENKKDGAPGLSHALLELFLVNAFSVVPWISQRF